MWRQVLLSEAEPGPHRGVIRWFFHASDVVVDASINTMVDQPLAGHDQVDPQSALGVILEPATAVVEPAETIIHCGILMPEGVHQPPVLESLQPLPFLRQKAALSSTQPAFGIEIGRASCRERV